MLTDVIRDKVDICPASLLSSHTLLVWHLAANQYMQCVRWPFKQYQYALIAPPKLFVLVLLLQKSLFFLPHGTRLGDASDSIVSTASVLSKTHMNTQNRMSIEVSRCEVSGRECDGVFAMRKQSYDSASWSSHPKKNYIAPYASLVQWTETPPPMH